MRGRALCTRHGVALHDAALQFATFHPAVLGVVVGAVTPAEATGNVGALERPIPPRLWTDLKQAGLLDVDAPVPAA